MFRTALTLSLVLLGAAFARPVAALTQEETDKIIKQIDYRQRSQGDYASQVYIERKERNKNDINYEAVVYRRTAGQKFVIMFQKPKDEAGKGYLRVDKNLFLYDPTVGKWERRTERERIAGTDSRRNDFDESHLAEEFNAKFLADEKLGGKVDVHHIKLEQKPNVDVAFPVGSGLNTARTVLEQHPRTKVVMLTGGDAPESLRAALDLGVHGYIRKAQRIEDIAAALDKVAAGTRSSTSSCCTGRAPRRRCRASARRSTG